MMVNLKSLLRVSLKQSLLQCSDVWCFHNYLMIVFMSCSLDKWYIFLDLFRKYFHTSSLHFSLGSLSEQSCIGIESGQCSWVVPWWSWWLWKREPSWSWPGQNWRTPSWLLARRILWISGLLGPSALMQPCPGGHTAWPDGFVLVIILVLSFLKWVNTDRYQTTLCEIRYYVYT